VVARSVLESVLDEAAKPHVWNGDTVSFVDEDRRLAPGDDGLYDLAP